MEKINKFEHSLGLESFDVLGFRSEDELEREILKLIKIRSEFKSKFVVDSN